jgi:glutathione S-transferase
MKFKLHCFAQSGNAYKTALMLNLCGADWDPIYVDFFNGEHREPAYLKLNEFGEVPVLEAGELVLSQSGVILDYLAESFEQFDGSSVPEHREIMRWLFFDNHKLTSNIATLRFLTQFKKTGETDVTKFLRGRATQALDILERRLTDAPFVVGEEISIADISLCGYLFYGDELTIDLSAYPGITQWLERIKGHEGWVHPYELMPGYDGGD